MHKMPNQYKDLNQIYFCPLKTFHEHTDLESSGIMKFQLSLRSTVLKHYMVFYRNVLLITVLHFVYYICLKMNIMYKCNLLSLCFF